MSTTDIGLLPTLLDKTRPVLRKNYESNKRAETSQPRQSRQQRHASQSVRVEDQQCHLPGPTFSPAPRFRSRRPNTQAGYFNRISPGVTSSSASLPRVARTSPDPTLKRITTVSFASWGCCCRLHLKSSRVMLLVVVVVFAFGSAVGI